MKTKPIEQLADDANKGDIVVINLKGGMKYVGIYNRQIGGVMFFSGFGPKLTRSQRIIYEINSNILWFMRKGGERSGGDFTFNAESYRIEHSGGAVTFKAESYRILERARKNYREKPK